MSLKTRAFLVIVVGTVMGLGLSVGGDMLSDRTPRLPADISWEQARLIAEVMQHVKHDYVDSIDDRELIDSAVRSMVAGLDPHSQFLDADEYEEIRISTSGSYSGVGIEVSTTNDQIIVIAPIDGTPAQTAGIRSGDQIIAIDNIDINKKNLHETVSRMRGRLGTQVILTVYRKATDQALVFSLKRENIRVASVHSELLGPDLAYLRISQFSDTTAREVSDAIDRMVDQAQRRNGNSLSGLVLDLRNNPGGILNAAVEVSDLFLESGIIVTADGRTPESRFTRDASGGDVLDGAAMVVLVNEGSASASEIVAGALQDHARATVVGTSTFGKGLVQTVMPLSKGRAIKLTTSRYYTPSGDSIHETGIAPDVLVEGSPDYPSLNSGEGVDRVNDQQLHEAMEYLRHRRVMHSDAS